MEPKLLFTFALFLYVKKKDTVNDQVIMQKKENEVLSENNKEAFKGLTTYDFLVLIALS